MQCYIKLFLFLGQLWQLFEVSQILEFLRYYSNLGVGVGGSYGVSKTLLYLRYAMGKALTGKLSCTRGLVQLSIFLTFHDTESK